MFRNFAVSSIDDRMQRMHQRVIGGSDLQNVALNYLSPQFSAHRGSV